MVARYNFSIEQDRKGNPYCDSYESIDGDFVKYEDYQQVENEIQILKNNIKELTKDLNDALTNHF